MSKSTKNNNQLKHLKMNKLNYYNKKLILLSFAFLTIISAQSQDAVVQENIEWKPLRFRPNVSLGTPLTHEEEITLPMNVNLEGYYELGKLADVRAGLHYGSFKGVSLGGTLHMADRMVNRYTPFMVAETSKKIYFYKGRCDLRSIIGPAVDLKIGSYSASGFYARMDAGIDFQTFARAYYKGYRAGRNGFSSLKLMATAAKFNQSEVISLSDNANKSRFGAGGLVRFAYDVSPWNKITLFAGGDLGFIAIFGVDDYVDQYVTIENTKSNMIMELKVGITLSL